jgi:hypothetical protein
VNIKIKINKMKSRRHNKDFELSHDRSTGILLVKDFDKNTFKKVS